jgi:hypothetical protein
MAGSRRKNRRLARSPGALRARSRGPVKTDCIRTSDLPCMRWSGAQKNSVHAGQSATHRSNWTPQSTCSESLALFWPYEFGWRRPSDQDWKVSARVRKTRSSRAPLLERERRSPRLRRGKCPPPSTFRSGGHPPLRAEVQQSERTSDAAIAPVVIAAALTAVSVGGRRWWRWAQPPP